MFESLPLPVGAGLAARVAADPGRWLMELTSAYRTGRCPPLYSWREQHPLLTDVPVWVWRYAFEDEAAGVAASDRAAFRPPRVRSCATR